MEKPQDLKNESCATSCCSAPGSQPSDQALCDLLCPFGLASRPRSLICCCHILSGNVDRRHQNPLPGGSDMGATVSPAEVLEPPKSFAARSSGVFFSPGATFADIARKPGFIPPLVAGILASMVVTETMLWKIGMERIVRQQIEHSSRGATMTPEQVQQGVEQGARIGGIIAHAAGVLGMPVGMLIVTGIGLLIVSAVFGSPVRFATAVLVACFAGLVDGLSLLMGPAMI